MDEVLVEKIEYAIESFENINGLDYETLPGVIGQNKTYLTYSKVQALPEYEVGICKTTYDINIFDRKLGKAQEVRTAIASHLSSIQNEAVILEINIEDERDTFDNEYKVFQASVTVKILHRITGV